jgi:hypothetical protein
MRRRPISPAAAVHLAGGDARARQGHPRDLIAFSFVF